MNVVIRSETPADVAAIRDVVIAAFPTPGEADLVEALRHQGLSRLSLVAEVDGAVAGHILFSPVTIADAHPGLGLAPVAVHPRLHRQGIGSRLIEEGLRQARASGAHYCVVLGDPAYYERFGFRHARPLGLDNEYGADHEFMAQELAPGGLTGRSGLVRYSSPFRML